METGLKGAFEFLKDPILGTSHFEGFRVKQEDIRNLLKMPIA